MISFSAISSHFSLFAISNHLSLAALLSILLTIFPTGYDSDTGKNFDFKTRKRQEPISLIYGPLKSVSNTI